MARSDWRVPPSTREPEPRVLLPRLGRCWGGSGPWPAGLGERGGAGPSLPEISAGYSNSGAGGSSCRGLGRGGENGAGQPGAGTVVHGARSGVAPLRCRQALRTPQRAARLAAGRAARASRQRVTRNSGTWSPVSERNPLVRPPGPARTKDQRPSQAGLSARLNPGLNGFWRSS